MYRLRSLFALPLLVAALFLAIRPAAHAQGAAAAWIIADDSTGMVLGSSNAQKKLQVASLTKIATAMVVLDWAEAKQQDLSQMAVAPDSVQALWRNEGVGFRPGDQCSLRDLLYAALLQSDNQAAQTLADHVGRALGNSDSPVTFFTSQMNALARRLGMAHTRFLNPTGTDDVERSAPYSTAEDMAKLTRYAMDRASFRFYVSQRERRISISTAAGEPTGFLLKNTNELLGTDNIDGVKTGTTRKAGACLIISASRPPESRQEGETHIITPRRITVVVLGAQDRFGLARSLLATGWRQYDAWAAAGRPAKWKGQ